jgi:hypothetical protein
MHRLGADTFSEDDVARKCFRILLDAILQRLDKAPAEAFLMILEFKESRPEWSSSDEERLKRGLDAYRQEGLLNELNSLTNIDRLFELRIALQVIAEVDLQLEEGLRQVETEIVAKDPAGTLCKEWLKSPEAMPVDRLVVSWHGVEGIILSEEERLREVSDKEAARAMFRSLPS